MSITEFQDYDLHTKDWGFLPNAIMQVSGPRSVPKKRQRQRFPSLVLTSSPRTPHGAKAHTACRYVVGGYSGGAWRAVQAADQELVGAVSSQAAVECGAVWSVECF